MDGLTYGSVKAVALPNAVLNLGSRRGKASAVGAYLNDGAGVPPAIQLTDLIIETGLANLKSVISTTVSISWPMVWRLRPYNRLFF
jgi:hypothetical protein